MKRYSQCLLLAAAIPATSVVAPALAQNQKPNVVFILVDNVGCGTFGAYGGTVPTPRIDKFASEGIRFNDCWRPISKSSANMNAA
jgi:hypothetical protein